MTSGRLTADVTRAGADYQLDRRWMTPSASAHYGTSAAAAMISRLAATAAA